MPRQKPDSLRPWGIGTTLAGVFWIAFGAGYATVTPGRWTEVTGDPGALLWQFAPGVVLLLLGLYLWRRGGAQD